MFLKLDFSKAYDQVDLASLLKTMQVMGFSLEFVDMTRLLFNGTQARVNVNGRYMQYFDIKPGVRQGCPLAPYIFLIIGEILNHCIKQETS